jgi:hypothetical protein
MLERSTVVYVVTVLTMNLVATSFALVFVVGAGPVADSAPTRGHARLQRV